MRPTMGKQGGPGTPDGHSKGQVLLEGQNNEDQVHKEAQVYCKVTKERIRYTEGGHEEEAQ